MNFHFESLALDRETRILSTERGSVRLPNTPYQIASRLLKRPGAIVPISDFVLAVWPHGADEPEFAHNIIKNSICDLRGFIALAAPTVVIKCDRSVGYYLVQKRGEVSRGA